MPSCKSQMISLCPNCGFLLIGNSHAHICGFCKADIRLSFANSQSGTRTAGDCILVPTDFVDGGSHRLVRDRLPQKETMEAVVLMLFRPRIDSKVAKRAVLRECTPVGVAIEFDPQNAAPPPTPQAGR